MTEPTEADIEAVFAALWENIKKRHDAEHGAGDAERQAREAAVKFGLGVMHGPRHVPLDEFLALPADDTKERSDGA